MNIFAGMRMLRYYILAVLLGGIPGAASAQFNVRDSARQAFLINVSVSFAQPGYDLKQRFGPFASIGLSSGYKTRKGWIFAINAAFLFNEKVLEKDAISGILTVDGFLIGGDGTLYDLTYQMRGMQLDFSLSHLIPRTGHNKNSGIFAGLGLGYIDHRIRYEPEDRNAPLPQLDREKRKGYDRLSGGWILRPALGYQYMGNKRLVNFFVQLEHAYAGTVSLRNYQFDHPGKFNENRTDGFWSIRFGWTLPIYRKPATEYFAY
jgi:hypothetical protein